MKWHIRRTSLQSYSFGLQSHPSSRDSQESVCLAQAEENGTLPSSTLFFALNSISSKKNHLHLHQKRRGRKFSAYHFGSDTVHRNKFSFQEYSSMLGYILV